MVESQAIARVNRLGQKRNVRVVRYIMKDTVEEVGIASLCQTRSKSTNGTRWNYRHSKLGNSNMLKLDGRRIEYLM